MTPTPPILCQLDAVPSSFLAWFVVALFGVLLVTKTVLEIVDRVKAKRASAMIVTPDPLRVESVDRLATRKELIEMASNLERDIDKLRAAFERERVENNAEKSKLHKRVDEVVESLAETKGLLVGVKQNTDILLQRSMK